MKLGNKGDVWGGETSGNGTSRDLDILFIAIRVKGKVKVYVSFDSFLNFG